MREGGGKEGEEEEGHRKKGKEGEKRREGRPLIA